MRAMCRGWLLDALRFVCRAATIARALAAADSHAAMAVADPAAGVWLVYGMLQLATRNHAVLAGARAVRVRV